MKVQRRNVCWPRLHGSSAYCTSLTCICWPFFFKPSLTYSLPSPWKNFLTFLKLNFLTYYVIINWHTFCYMHMQLLCSGHFLKCLISKCFTSVSVTSNYIWCLHQLYEVDHRLLLSSSCKGYEYWVLDRFCDLAQSHIVFSCQ